MARVHECGRRDPLREEAESGNAEGAIAEQKRLMAEAAALEEARLASQLGRIMSMNGVSAGFSTSSGHLPELEKQGRTRRDLEKQLIGLLARCGEEFKARARRRRRWRIIRRVLAGVALGAFLWFVRKTAPAESSAAVGASEREERANELQHLFCSSESGSGTVPRAHARVCR